MVALPTLCLPGRYCGGKSLFSVWRKDGLLSDFLMDLWDVLELCESLVELFYSFTTLYLSNLGKNDPGGHGCLFSLMSSGPLTNAMKILHCLNGGCKDRVTCFNGF